MIENEMKFFFLIILFIVFYDIYFVYLLQENIKPIPNTVIEIDNTDNNTVDNTNDNTNDNTDNTNDNIDINLYGEPYEYVENKYIIWISKPWSKIVYKYSSKKNKTYPFYFFIKIKIPSLNNYLEWKNLINNIDFDQQSGEIIIPTKDEETALSIVNLMLSNFKGDISFQEILDKNLIDISIAKSKKSVQIKNKLIELIIATGVSTQESPNVFEKKVDEPQIQDTQQTVDRFGAYDGTEYSSF
jgi:hypothetical protein